MTGTITMGVPESRRCSKNWMSGRLLMFLRFRAGMTEFLSGARDRAVLREPLIYWRISTWRSAVRKAPRVPFDTARRASSTRDAAWSRNSSGAKERSAHPSYKTQPR
jgi:hypothetical protein